MQIIALIFMYLGFIQSPDQVNDPRIQAQYQPEMNQIRTQVPGNVTNATIGNPGDPNSLTVTVDGTPVIIDIQQF